MLRRNGAVMKFVDSVLLWVFPSVLWHCWLVTGRLVRASILDPRTCGGRQPEGNQLTQIHLEKRSRKWRWCSITVLSDALISWLLSCASVIRTVVRCCCCNVRLLRHWITFLCYWVSAAGTKKQNLSARELWVSGRRWVLRALNRVSNKIVDMTLPWDNNFIDVTHKL